MRCRGAFPLRAPASCARSSPYGVAVRLVSSPDDVPAAPQVDTCRVPPLEGPWPWGRDPISEPLARCDSAEMRQAGEAVLGDQRLLHLRLLCDGNGTGRRSGECRLPGA